MSISPLTPKLPQFSGNKPAKDARTKNGDGRLFAVDIKPSVRNPKLDKAGEALAQNDLQTLDELLIEAPALKDQLKPVHNSNFAIQSALAQNPDIEPKELQRLLLTNAIHRGLPTDGFFKSEIPV